MESPIACLTAETCDLLALGLNGRKLLLSDDKLQRDWRGVAECLHCGWERQQRFQDTASPTKALLVHCRTRPLQDLQQALQLVGRHDVWDDAHLLIERDAAKYLECLVQVSSDRPNVTASAANNNDSLVMCVGDAECLREGRPLTRFDAFLLYDDADAHFAMEIIQRMEGRGVRLCDRERHLLPGVTFEHAGIIDLIRVRCDRVLAVLSPNFLQSEVNNFLAMFSQVKGLETQRCSLVPCVYESCVLPPYLMYCARLDFTRVVGMVDVWEKMYETLILPIQISDTPSSERSVTEDPSDSRVRSVVVDPSDSGVRSMTMDPFDSGVRSMTMDPSDSGISTPELASRYGLMPPTTSSTSCPGDCSTRSRRSPAEILKRLRRRLLGFPRTQSQSGHIVDVPSLMSACGIAPADTGSENGVRSQLVPAERSDLVSKSSMVDFPTESTLVSEEISGEGETSKGTVPEASGLEVDLEAQLPDVPNEEPAEELPKRPSRLNNLKALLPKGKKNKKKIKVLGQA